MASDLAYILGQIRQKQPYLLWASEKGAYLKEPVNVLVDTWRKQNPKGTRKEASQFRVVVQNQMRAEAYRQLPEETRAEYSQRFKDGKSIAPELPEEK